MRKVERAIGQIAHRAGYDSPYAEDLKAPVEYESSDFSTNVTASNMLGAGCTVDGVELGGPPFEGQAAVRLYF